MDGAGVAGGLMEATVLHLGQVEGEDALADVLEAEALLQAGVHLGNGETLDQVDGGEGRLDLR